MTEDLFKETESFIDPNKNYYEDLVGDGKKFKDNESLAKGKYLADKYIDDLVRQKDELRNDYLKLQADYNSRAKLEEILDKIDKNQSKSGDENPNVTSNTQQPSFDPKQMETLISSKISEYETTKKQSENFNLVQGKLRERFGDNYQPILKTQIDSLGLSIEDVNQMARTRPMALSKLLGLDEKPQQTFQTPPRNTGRMTDPFQPSGGKKRTWSYYQEIKKANKNAYWDPKTQFQMHQDHAALGAEFEDGDFNAYG